ncbi:hypothetical protein M501DRAFT_16029 [Patellaria atrata CBS 101060]|uniref:Pre-mRNA-processing factor 39 n=1 Tax=Patellaria atrata CBS 101060 TaxID=1346257 RepID=A0A9P4SHP4_9PEZI|nr:hypothetical protein M501DRAFT_16029 [Patellaria atrata CBS 101060]
MAEFTFDAEEDFAEVKQLNEKVLSDPDDFESWEKLVTAAQGLEGGLNRNSSEQAITFTRIVYDSFLQKFPLFFGYWKKYADLEFSIAGTEAAEMIYERGVASISSSVDLWTNYCTFKVETSHDSDVIRELFERGANFVGLDFLSHPFWDKYLEFEERLEAPDRIFAILDRIISIPMHQYARYFERYRQLAAQRPVAELIRSENLAPLRAELELELNQKRKSDVETERELRARIDVLHLEVFHRTQTETTKRWTYEQEIKRPYFHVTELDDAQLANWRKYLDFEEAEGDFSRITFLYERCLVTCAYYDGFWMRYARWMHLQPGRNEEVRHIYQRACSFFVPIAKPAVRLHYAWFEEACGRIDVAQAIFESILIKQPNYVETIIEIAHLRRRHTGLDSAFAILQEYIDAKDSDSRTKAALVAECAEMLWKNKGSPEEARALFERHQPYYSGVSYFWNTYFRFELGQPTSEATERTQFVRIKKLLADVRKSELPAHNIKQLAHVYMEYLQKRGGPGAAKEYMQLDREVNG